MQPLHITRVVNCVGDRGVGLADWLSDKLLITSIATAYARKFHAIVDRCDRVEFAFPFGRENFTTGDRKGQARWVSPPPHLLGGFKLFLDRLAPTQRYKVAIQLPCPDFVWYFSFKRHLSAMPDCFWCFDDIGTRAPVVLPRLLKFLSRSAFRYAGSLLESIPCNGDPKLPGAATTLKLPTRFGDSEWRVRAKILWNWYDRREAINTWGNPVTPLFMLDAYVRDGLKLNVLFTGAKDKDDRDVDYITEALWQELRPHIHGVTLMNAPPAIEALIAADSGDTDNDKDVDVPMTSGGETR